MDRLLRERTSICSCMWITYKKIRNKYIWRKIKPTSNNVAVKILFFILFFYYIERIKLNFCVSAPNLRSLYQSRK